jgi:hypothetical protein
MPGLIQTGARFSWLVRAEPSCYSGLSWFRAVIGRRGRLAMTSRAGALVLSLAGGDAWPRQAALVRWFSALQQLQPMSTSRRSLFCFDRELRGNLTFFLMTTN